MKTIHVKSFASIIVVILNLSVGAPAFASTIQKESDTAGSTPGKGGPMDYASAWSEFAKTADKLALAQLPATEEIRCESPAPYAQRFDPNRRPQSPSTPMPLSAQVRGVRGSMITLPCGSSGGLDVPFHSFPWTRPAANPFERLAFLLELPAGTSVVNVVDPSPTWDLDYRQIGTNVLVWAKVAPDADDTALSIQLTNGNTYTLFQPVNISIHRCDSPGLQFQTAVGDRLDVEICASGPIAGATWRYVPDLPGVDVPQGLSLLVPPSTIPAGAARTRVRIAPEVGPDARTTGGTLDIVDTTRGVIAYGRLRVEVAPNLMAPAQQTGRLTWRLAEWTVPRRANVRLDLPPLGGADGTYQIAYDPASSLPYGHLNPTVAGASASIAGAVVRPVTSGRYELRLRLSAPSHVEVSTVVVPVIVDAGTVSDFSLWTQNTLLRNARAPAWTNFIEAAAYHSAVQNTPGDNAARTRLIIDKMFDRRTWRSADPTPVAFDIVALQEVFDPENETQLANAVGGAFSLQLGPGTAPRQVNSGLALAVRSDRAVLLHRSIPFGFGRGGDEYANKGFTVTHVKLGPENDDFVCVVNTHTDADDGSTSDAANRARQFEMIRNEVIATCPSANPVLVVGDLNVAEQLDAQRRPVGEHATMLSALGMSADADIYRSMRPSNTRGIVDDNGYTSDRSRNAYAAAWFPDDPIARLDYVLVRQGSRYLVTARDIVMVDDDLPWLPAGGARNAQGNAITSGYLSDHYGLRADLRLIER